MVKALPGMDPHGGHGAGWELHWMQIFSAGISYNVQLEKWQVACLCSVSFNVVFTPILIFSFYRSHNTPNLAEEG